MDSSKQKIECLRLISDGSGVGYINGVATFVPGLLPGESAEVKVLKAKKKWQRAALMNIIKCSPERIAAPCTVFEECGGCQLQHTTYDETLRWKQRWVEDALARIGKISVEVKPTLGMEYPWRYRNKARLHRLPTGELGYYKEKSKALVKFQDCLLLSERMNRWIKLTEKLIGEGHPEIHTLTFRENTKQEGLLIMEGAFSDALAICQRPDFFPGLSKDGLSSVWNVDAEGNLRLLKGAEKFRQEILDITFDLSPLAFLQVNSVQTDVLYSLVLEQANLTGEEIVWDLYSGIGTLTLALAKIARKVTGIEENPYAVENALQNSINNHTVEKVEFLKGKVEEQMMKLEERPDVIVLDPPRAGIHADVLKRLIELKPQRIIYVSCDPGTLARDLGGLTAGGYEIGSVQPVDMFAWTEHTEAVVLLQRLKT